MSRNLICWAVVLIGYVALFAVGHSQPITMERRSDSMWAKILKRADQVQFTSRPDPKGKPVRPAPPPPPEPPATRAEAEQLIRISACVGQADRLAPRLQRAVRVSPVLAEDASKVQRGASHLGGGPDVPSGFAWPTKGTTPLTFVGQINLTDVAPLDEDAQLPKSGWLCFFYGTALQPSPSGAEPNDRGGWQVRYFTGQPAALQRMATPKAIAKEEFPLCSVRYWKEWNLPEPADEPNMFWDDESDSCMGDLCAALTGRPKEYGWHHLLGYGQGWQPMRERCQLAANGVRYDEDFDPNAPGVEELLAEKDAWVLLLQVALGRLDEMDAPPEGAQGTMGGWRRGLAKRVQYWIRREDLAAQKFDGVWVLGPERED